MGDGLANRVRVVASGRVLSPTVARRHLSQLYPGEGPTVSEPCVKNEPGCWYYQTFYECPICGSGGIYRERRPPPRPEDPVKRYEFQQFGCAGGAGCYSFL